MEKLSIVETENTPKILFDPTHHVFELSGCSMADDPVTFYQPVIDWIKQYATTVSSPIWVMFKFQYFNTASAKALFDILSAWALAKNCTIVWYHAEAEDDIKQAGEELAELVNIPFEFKTY
jgi:hypothetical protein